MVLSDGSVRTDSPRIVPSAKWHYDIFCFIAYPGDQVAPPGTRFFMAIDELGRVVGLPGESNAFWVITNEWGVADVTVIPVSFLHVSGLALTFLHAKNVEIVEPDQIRRRRVPRERKYERRFHQLKVNAIGEQKRHRGEGKSTGIEQSLHIVRGHFREYGPEFDKGLLFGKYAGRYWVASHFKGSSEVGQVDKEYKVE
jgi:hypothetical protein